MKIEDGEGGVSKKPLLEWGRWQVERQTLEEFESQPWDRADGYAIVCGYPNVEGLYLAVVDYDVKKVGDEARARGVGLLGRLPETRVERTVSGGLHYIYLSRVKPRPVARYHDSCALELVAGSKICIMAPSRGYTVEKDKEPTVVEDAEGLFYEALGVEDTRGVGEAGDTSMLQKWFKEIRHHLESMGKIKGEGQNYIYCSCPFHPPDRNPSFAIHKSRYYAVDYHDNGVYSLKELAGKLGVELPEIENTAGDGYVKKLKRRQPALLHDNILYETVLDRGGAARFLCFRNGGWELKDHIEVRDETGGRIEVYPASINEQPYRPYRLFEGWDGEEDPRKLYDDVLSFIRRRVDAPIENIMLMALDVFLTYFQEKVETLHYLYFVGDNESGKTRALQVMSMLAYRGFLATDVSAANLIEFLGDESDGLVRGSIFEDEAEDIVSDPDKRRLYKHGYKKGGRIPRILLNKERGLRIQRFYNAYCFKAAAAEELPEGKHSRGLLERFIVMKMVRGCPEKDTLDEKDYEEADKLKLRLLKLRLKYFGEPLPEASLKLRETIDDNIFEEQLSGRNRELFEGVLRIAAFINALDDAKSVVGYFVGSKIKAMLNSVEGIICRALFNLLKNEDLDDGGWIDFENNKIMEEIARITGGKILEKETSWTVATEDFKLTAKALASKLRNSFQAETVVKKQGEDTVRVKRIKKKVLRLMLSKYHLVGGAVKNAAPNMLSAKNNAFPKQNLQVTDVTDVTVSPPSRTVTGVPESGVEAVKTMENHGFGASPSTPPTTDMNRNLSESQYTNSPGESVTSVESVTCKERGKTDTLDKYFSKSPGSSETLSPTGKRVEPVSGVESSGSGASIPSIEDIQALLEARKRYGDDYWLASDIVDDYVRAGGKYDFWRLLDMLSSNEWLKTNPRGWLEEHPRKKGMFRVRMG